MEFLVCTKQKHEGCDYSIACGMKYEIIKANSISDAIVKTIYPDGIGEWCAIDEHELELDEILIIPTTDLFTVNIPMLKAGRKSKHETDNQNTIEIEERAELQRLLQKYK